VEGGQVGAGIETELVGEALAQVGVACQGLALAACALPVSSVKQRASTESGVVSSRYPGGRETTRSRPPGSASSRALRSWETRTRSAPEGFAGDMGALPGALTAFMGWT
jgi:hypothetical protein